MTDKLREAALWKLLTEAREALWQPANPDLCGRIDEALAQQDAQAVPQDLRYTPGHVLVPNQVAWGIVGSSGHARKRAVDALRELLNAAPTPPAQAATCKQDLQVDALLDEMLDTLPYNSPDYWIGRIREVRYGTPFRRNNHG